MAKQDTVDFSLEDAASDASLGKEFFPSGAFKGASDDTRYTKRSFPTEDSVQPPQYRDISMGFSSTFFFTH